MPKYKLHYLCKHERISYYPGKYDDLPTSIKSNPNLVSIIEETNQSELLKNNKKIGLKQSINDESQIKPKEFSINSEDKKEQINDIGIISRTD